jgi:hypothetical protein
MNMGKADALREAASRSTLDELVLRPPPRTPGRIPVHPDTDGAAILARVMAEPTSKTTMAIRAPQSSTQLSWRRNAA